MRDAAQQSQGIAGIGAGFAFAQQMNTTAAQPQEPVVKEVIRIKCPNCGELNKEDSAVNAERPSSRRNTARSAAGKWRPTVSSAVHADRSCKRRKR